MRIIKNVDLYDYKSYKPNMYIVFDHEIREVGNMSNFNIEKYSNDEVIDMKGHLVIPGFVNGHTHIYSTFARGINLPFNPCNFREILDQLWWKIDSKIDKETLKYSALMYGGECISNGVTTVIDHNASGEFIKGSSAVLEEIICKKLKMNGVFCYETSDRFQVEECIKENMGYMRESSEFSKGLFGMHASMSLSDESLKSISDNLNCDPIHIHVGESKDDVVSCNKQYGSTIVERLDKYGLLNSNSILAHCVHIGEKEMGIIKERGAVIAVNPSSNLNNAVGIPDVRAFIQKGIPVILGTDGLGSSIAQEYVNLMHIMKGKYAHPCSFGFDDLRKIILSGYKYVSDILGRKIGSLEEGFTADMQCYPYRNYTSINEDNVFSHVFYGLFMNQKPQNVFSRGYWMKKDGELESISEKDYSEALKISEKFWKKIWGSESNA